jgi:hypothetical protein
MTLSRLPFKLPDDPMLVACASHLEVPRGYTWKLEGSLKVIEDEFGEDTKPMVMLKQDQLGSIFDGPESLYDTGQTIHISYEL